MKLSRYYTALIFASLLYFLNQSRAADVSDLTYKVSGGKITITSCDKATSGKLVIPDTIEGKPVTRIGDFAFVNCTSLTSITIPDGVTSIGHAAFAACESMNAVTFLGDAPKVKNDDTFKYSSSIIYRKPEAKGWGDTFAGRPVKLISEKP